KAGSLEESLNFFRLALPGAATAVSAAISAGEFAPPLYKAFVEDAKQYSKWDAVREAYCIVWRATPAEKRPEVESRLRVLNDYVIFSQNPATDSTIYTVKSNDNLSKIAAANGTMVNLIVRINKLRNDKITVGQKLKLLQGRAAVVARKSTFSLTLLFNDKFIRSYQVGTGREGIDNQTPVGAFTVTTLEENPFWYKGNERIPPGDPRNILGTRWIGISAPHYGIHGTTDDSSIGTASSAGCIRMRNGEVEELYDFLHIGDAVTIEE
ncbi:MAG: L,D-transpeptidase family protein, partial [Candidatus Brocadiia bacterium]